jgi:hypothetical protein
VVVRVVARASRGDKPGEAKVELQGERLEVTMDEARRTFETAWLAYGWAFDGEPNSVNVSVWP